MARRITRFLLPILSCLVVLHLGNCRTNWDPDDCPTFCKCFLLYGLRWAECVGRHLYSIHTGVKGAVQALDLSNNSIASLGDNELREADLANLKLLNISSNAVSTIGLLAFAGLTDLKVLDLSDNHLYYVQTDIFLDNRRLEVLELADNNFNSHVPRLRSLSLASLNLARCRISNLPSSTFDQLPRLRALDLSNNMMILVEANVLLGIQNLAVLLLERNPWFCNDDMFRVQDRLREKGVLFKEFCWRNQVPRSKAAPKMLEKIVLLNNKTSVSGSLGGNGRLLTKIKNRQSSGKAETTSERCPFQVPSTPKSQVSSESLRITTSTYLFLAVGFVVGAATSMVATYIWLTRTMSYSIGNVESPSVRDESNQRVSLLQHLWQNNDETHRTAVECPNTPPPPYRDVILHANRYPRPHIQNIVFGNEPSLNSQRQVQS